jgi:hypothetical protein
MVPIFLLFFWLLSVLGFDPPLRYLDVIAPSEARRILQGESPCREEISNDFL